MLGLQAPRQVPCWRISPHNLVSAALCHPAQATASQGLLVGLQPMAGPRGSGREVSLGQEPLAFGASPGCQRSACVYLCV